MDAFLTSEGLLALATLTFLEVILGVDNVIFISILAGKLPAAQQARARGFHGRRGYTPGPAPRHLCSREQLRQRGHAREALRPALELVAGGGQNAPTLRRAPATTRT